MDPLEDENTDELLKGLSLTDELQHGMAVLWRRLKAIKSTLPHEDPAGNTCAGDLGD